MKTRMTERRTRTRTIKKTVPTATKNPQIKQTEPARAGLVCPGPADVLASILRQPPVKKRQIHQAIDVGITNNVELPDASGVEPFSAD